MHSIVWIILAPVLVIAFLSDEAKRDQMMVQQFADGLFVMQMHSVKTLEDARTLNVFSHAAVPERLRFFGDIATKVLKSLDLAVAVRVGMSKPLPGDRERHFGVIFVDSLDSLYFLYTEYSKYHLYVSGNYLIVLHTFEPHYYEELNRISELNWEGGLVNCNVLVYAPPGVLLLFSSFPFNRFHCKGHAPIMWNRYVNGAWQHADFFPDKLSNLHGCPLVCATWPDMPYLKVPNRNGLISHQHRPIGLEGKLLVFLAWKLNFTVEFRWMDERQIAGTLMDDQRVFDELYESGVSFAIGSYHYKKTEQTDSYALTDHYYMSTFKFVVNSKPEPFSPFTKLLFAFDRYTWLLILLMFFCCLAFIWTFNGPSRHLVLGHNNRTPFYNMFVVSLGAPVDRPPHTFTARFLLGQWLVAAFILRCTYTALVYYFIRTDVGVPPPDTIAELSDRNYTCLMSETISHALNRSQQTHGMRCERLSVSELEGFDQLRRWPSDSKMAILTPYEYFGYYKLRNRQHLANFHLVAEPMFTQQLSIYMQRNTIFLSRFNQHIHAYLAGGLMEHWRLHYTVSSMRDTKLDGDGDVPESMDMHKLIGPFRLLQYGCIAGFLIFIAELIVHLIGRCFLALWMLCSAARGSLLAKRRTKQRRPTKVVSTRYKRAEGRAWC